MARLAAAGLGASAIGAELGRSKQSVHTRASSLSIRLGQPRPVTLPDPAARQATEARTARRWTAEDDAALARLAAAGLGASAIGDELGRSKQSVHTRASSLSIRLGQPRPVTLPDPAARQAAEDAAAAVVADADLETIRAWMREHAKVDTANHPSAIILAHANRHRAKLGLPPFRLTRRAGDAA